MNNLNQQFLASQKWKPADSKRGNDDETETKQPPYPDKHATTELHTAKHNSIGIRHNVQMLYHHYLSYHYLRKQLKVRSGIHSVNYKFL